jgi:four helix bundle protein
MENKPADIRERTFQFGLEVVKSIEKIPHTRAGNVIANQLIRSATSIGANAQEALSANSKADFTYKTNIALCEARETYYWLRLLKESGLLVDKGKDTLMQEADEITRILGAIVSTSRGKRKI